MQPQILVKRSEQSRCSRNGHWRTDRKLEEFPRDVKRPPYVLVTELETPSRRPRHRTSEQGPLFCVVPGKPSRLKITTCFQWGGVVQIMGVCRGLRTPAPHLYFCQRQALSFPGLDLTCVLKAWVLTRPPGPPLLGTPYRQPRPSACRGPPPYPRPS